MAKEIDQEKALKAELARLQPGQFIAFCDKRAVGRWADTIQAMQTKGLIETKIVQIDDQSSELRLYPSRGVQA